ncbi:UvrD-helicase domain-containing protein [Thermovibrio ammonificans]
MIELIEANAGAGKTTEIVSRYVEFIRQKFSVDEVVLTTFTEAAAAQLRDRVKLALIEEISSCVNDEGTKEHLETQLLYLPTAPIGTIHSFCFELLRRFGVSKGLISLEARLASPIEVAELAERAVESAVEEVYSADSEGFRKLLTAIDPNGLEGLLTVERFLKEVIHHRTRFPFVHTVSPEEFFEKAGREFKYIYREVFGSKNTLVKELLKGFKSLKLGSFELSRNQVKKRKKLEVEKVKLLHELLVKALARYDELLEENELLDYNSLLIKAEKLVREAPSEVLSSYRVFIIDEFQDTDPIQWRIIETLYEASQRGGSEISVLLVGDPKQSIYRFRSADVNLWNRVKEWVKEKGGKVTEKTENYRSGRKLLEFFNTVFKELYRKTTSHPAELDFVPFRPSERTAEGGQVEVIPIKSLSSYGLAPFVRYAVSKLKPYAERGTAAVIARSWSALVPFARYLKENGIPFTYLSSSPYRSEAFEELLNLLKFTLNPNDYTSLFFLLTSRFLGLTHPEALDLVEEVKEEGESPLLRYKLFRELKDFRSQLKERSVHPYSLQIYSLLLRLGYLSALRLSDPDSFSSLLDLLWEIYTVETVESFTFEELVHYLEGLGGDSASSAARVPERGFVLTTIHSSKGLEFNAVAVVPWDKPRPSYSRFTYSNIGYAVKLHAPRYDFSEEEEHLKPFYNWCASPYFFYLQKLNDFLNRLEEKNLFYVALTRAKEALILGLKERGKGKFSTGSITFDSSLLKGYLKQLPENPPAVRPDRSFVPKLLPEPSVNHIKIRRPSDHADPEELSTKENPHLPNGTSPTEYGDAAHALCEAFLKGADIDRAVNYALGHVLNPTPSLEERLRELYRKLSSNNPFPLEGSIRFETELPLLFYSEDSILRGRADLVFFKEGGSVEVWDFKTGLKEEAKLKLYREQLTAYADVFRRAGYTVNRLVLLFLDEPPDVWLEQFEP